VLISNCQVSNDRKTTVGAQTRMSSTHAAKKGARLAKVAERPANLSKAPTRLATSLGYRGACFGCDEGTVVRTRAAAPLTRPLGEPGGAKPRWYLSAVVVRKVHRVSA
jgi:hypothetical protein